MVSLLSKCSPSLSHQVGQPVGRGAVVSFGQVDPPLHSNPLSLKRILWLKKASFPPKTPPLVARSLHRNINLFSVFPGSTQIAHLLLQAGHCSPLSILLKVCDVPGKLLEERPCPAEQHHTTVATSWIFSWVWPISSCHKIYTISLTQILPSKMTSIYPIIRQP